VDDYRELKRQAGFFAADFVESGMILGLGHGSTAIFALRRIAERLHAGQLRDVLGVPCSRQVERDARELGIPLTSLEEHPEIDLTIDGADEVDSALNVIKGGGGALLHEKIVAQASRREMIVVDQSKLSPVLGTHWPVPVEIVPFGWCTQLAYLGSLVAEAVLRCQKDGTPLRTDEGNLIVDCRVGPISDVGGLARQLSERAGIVEHGLFVGLVTDVVVATEGEEPRHLQRGLL
jgi:ribose 5-phosphate isomerase A